MSMVLAMGWGGLGTSIAHPRPDPVLKGEELGGTPGPSFFLLLSLIYHVTFEEPLPLSWPQFPHL